MSKGNTIMSHDKIISTILGFDSVNTRFFASSWILGEMDLPSQRWKLA